MSPDPKPRDKDDLTLVKHVRSNRWISEVHISWRPLRLWASEFYILRQHHTSFKVVSWCDGLSSPWTRGDEAAPLMAAMVGVMASPEAIRA